MEMMWGGRDRWLQKKGEVHTCLYNGVNLGLHIKASSWVMTQIFHRQPSVRALLPAGPFGGIATMTATMQSSFAAVFVDHLLKFPFLSATVFPTLGTLFPMASLAGSLSSWRAHLIFGDSQKTFRAKYGD